MLALWNTSCCALWMMSFIWETLTPTTHLPRSNLFNPHQRCGYSDSPFARRDTFLYCRVWKWVGGGWHPGHGDTKRKFYLSKIHFFVIEKSIEDAKQKEKDVPDLLESIMRPTCLEKEALRRNLCKMTQFSPKWPNQKSKNSGFQLFGCPEIWRIPAGGQCQPSR